MRDGTPVLAPPQAPRLAIFDFDGTLADSLPWFSGVFDDVADTFGFRRADAAERETLRGLSSREIARRLGVSAWKLPRIVRHIRALKSRAGAEIALFPGATDLLQRLGRDGVRIAIVSSDTEDNVRLILGETNADLIGWYECGAPIFGKAASIRRVLKRTRISAGDTICIGDEVRDAEAARAAGCAFGAVSWGYARIDAFGPERPDRVFKTFDDIPAVFGARSGQHERAAS